MGDWSGGFGDSLDVSEVIRRFERWTFALANDQVGRASPDNDDVVQEGRIAVWHAAERADGRPGTPNYIATAARWRMREVISRGTWTGRETTRGKPSDPIGRETVPLDELSVQAVLEAADLLHRVELAYHYGEIHQAIAALSDDQRRYVVMRFWYRMSEPEMRPYLSCDPGWCWRGRDGARAVLRRSLGHLAGVT